MIDTISALIGFLVGIVAAAIAVELGLKKLFSPPDRSKLTRAWSLSELPAPLVVASRVDGVPVPKGGRAVTAHPYGGPREGLDVRKNPEVQANFAVDATMDRALLFLDDVRPGALALWTVEPRLIERLRAEFNRLWSRSTDHVERVSVAEISQKANQTVLTEGVVEEVVPYRGSFLMRLADKGERVGVLVEKDLPVHGRRVSVTGIVRTSSSGYPLLEAVEVKAAT